MSSFHIIGTGACGFLRMNYILRDYIPLRYKGGRGKYQNSFENWSDNELIWINKDGKHLTIERSRKGYEYESSLAQESLE